MAYMNCAVLLIIGISIVYNFLSHSGGMQERVIQILSIPIFVSVLFPSLYLEYMYVNG